jgi:hypothetical protein
MTQLQPAHFGPFSSSPTEYGNMGRDEQIEEREVLDSIFPDEITGTCLYSHVSYEFGLETTVPNQFHTLYSVKAKTKRNP